jgi:hypothetical protein
VAERSEAGWGIVQRVIDQREHTVEISIDFVVPKTQNPEALAGQVIVAFGVAAGVCIEVVLPTIDLDDETVLETYEIDNDIVAWRLTTKMEATLLP